MSPAQEAGEEGRPVVVALIGPVGSGKSVVREALARRGAATLNFDDYSRRLLVPGSRLLDKLREAFGAEYFHPDGSLNRAALAELIFREAAARERLNALVHPPMLELLRQDLEAFRAAPSAPVLVVEGAILGQLPVQGWFDRVVRVEAPAAERARRLEQRDGLSVAAAAQRVRAHEELGVGQEPADRVVDTGAGAAPVEEQTDNLWEWLVG